MLNLTKESVNKLPKVKDFGLRGLETTRLDTFIDAAFAFATTMLVISIGNIPKNFTELILAFKSIPSFLASFVSVVFIWLGHRKWSRRYGIENNVTIMISLSIVFILLIYVYPLRLVFSALFAWVSGGFFPSEFQITSASELTSLFVFYGIGFCGIAYLMGSLFLQSKKLKNELILDTKEILLTKYEISSWFIMGTTALLSAIFALIMPIHIGVFAGFVYSLLPIAMPAVSIHYSKLIENERELNE